MRKLKEKPLLTFVYDTREQRPYRLAIPDPRYFDDGGGYDEKLEAGDIGCDLDGQRQTVVVERKALQDFVACCGRERERFENELARLSAYGMAVIVIEAPFAQIRAVANPPSMTGRPGMSGDQCWRSIIHWQVVYPTVHWYCATNRTEGRMATQRYLEEFCRHRMTIEEL